MIMIHLNTAEMYCVRGGAGGEFGSTVPLLVDKANYVGPPARHLNIVVVVAGCIGVIGGLFGFMMGYLCTAL